MGELTAEKAGRKILLDRTGGGLLSSKKEKGVAGADSRGTARHHGLQARAVSESGETFAEHFAAAGSCFFCARRHA